MSLNNLKLGERIRLIRLSNLTSNEKLVLYTLNCYLNRKGIAWPKQARIANECGLCLRTVSEAFRTLRSKNLVVTSNHYREDGKQGSSNIEVMFEHFGAYLGYAPHA